MTIRLYVVHYTQEISNGRSISRIAGVYLDEKEAVKMYYQLSDGIITYSALEIEAKGNK